MRKHTTEHRSSHMSQENLDINYGKIKKIKIHLKNGQDSYRKRLAGSHTRITCAVLLS